MCHQRRQQSAVIKDGITALGRMQYRFFEVSKRPEVERFGLAFARARLKETLDTSRRSGKAERTLIETVDVKRLSLPFIAFNPDRSLDRYAPTIPLFFICLIVSRLQWNPIAPSKTTRHLIKNNNGYHHNSND